MVGIRQILGGFSVAMVTLTLATCVAAAGSAYQGCDEPTFSYKVNYHANPGTLKRILETARAGDVIYLEDGNYGRLNLKGNNADFVYIVAAKGKPPVFSSVSISGSHWLLSGLSIVGYSASGLDSSGWQRHEPLVSLGAGDNFVFQNNSVASSLELAWSMETRGVADRQALSDGVKAVNSSCVSIHDNHIYNIFNAIVIAGDQHDNNGKRYLISRNNINDFAGDGIDHAVSDVTISENKFLNGHDICHNICVHMDGIQGLTYNLRPDIVNRNVNIENNVIIVREKRDVELAADALQGITIFDGHWDNVTIENNVVVVNSWHGISVYGVKNLSIAHNTVVGTGDREAWIMVTNQKPNAGGAPTSNVAVRNNIAQKYIASVHMDGRINISDHNLVIDNPRKLFKVFDPENGSFDLHLRPNTAAIASGVGIPSAARDIEGRPRSDKPDLGAYNFK
jgi:parallel beta-helix repeat protein